MLAFMGINPSELMIVLVVLLVLFGGSQLPRLMRNLGRSATEFKKGLRDEGGDFDTPDSEQKA